MTKTETEWLVVKVGLSGWSVHSRHETREAAEFEARRCNIFSDAQFSAWKAEDHRRFCSQEPRAVQA